MESIAESVNTRQQVLDALAQFDDAHRAAESAAAAWNDIKVMVGTNEQSRKEQQRSMPPETYASLTAECHEAEKVKVAAAAHLERTEKQLNVLRELLQHETAELWQTISAERAMTAAMEDTTAQRLVMVNRKTLDTPARYAPRPTNGRTPDDDLDDDTRPF